MRLKKANEYEVAKIDSVTLNTKLGISCIIYKNGDSEFTTIVNGFKLLKMIRVLEKELRKLEKAVFA